MHLYLQVTSHLLPRGAGRSLTCMSQAESPEPEVGGCIRNAPQTVLNGVDGLMDKHVSKVELKERVIKPISGSLFLHETEYNPRMCTWLLRCCQYSEDRHCHPWGKSIRNTAQNMVRVHSKQKVQGRRHELRDAVKDVWASGSKRGTKYS